MFCKLLSFYTLTLTYTDIPHFMNPSISNLSKLFIVNQDDSRYNWQYCERACESGCVELHGLCGVAYGPDWRGHYRQVRQCPLTIAEHGGDRLTQTAADWDAYFKAWIYRVASGNGQIEVNMYQWQRWMLAYELLLGNLAAVLSICWLRWQC